MTLRANIDSCHVWTADHPVVQRSSKEFVYEISALEMTIRQDDIHKVQRGRAARRYKGFLMITLTEGGLSGVKRYLGSEGYHVSC